MNHPVPSSTASTGHTPGPWTVGGPNVRTNASLGIHGGEAEPFVIADLCSDGYDEKTQRANAARIVLCVNNHDALVAMVRDLRSELFLRLSGSHDPKTCAHWPEIVAADALLSKIGGPQ